MTTTLFSYNKSGQLEEIKKAPTLAIGTKVKIISSEYDCFGAIIAEDKNLYKIVKLDENNAGFTFSDKHHIQPLSRKFGIGTYFVDTLEIVAPEIIAEFITKGHAADAKKQEEKEAKILADQKEQDELPDLYPNLKPVSKTDYSEARKETKRNLVAELKENFKDTKFSVKADKYGSCYISWINGSTERNVKQIVNKFIDHESSNCGDYRDLNESNFNKVFGGFKYVFTTREMSEEIKALLPIVKEQLTDTPQYYADELLWKIFATTTISKEATNFTFERETDLGADNFYKINFEGGFK